MNTQLILNWHKAILRCLCLLVLCVAAFFLPSLAVAQDYDLLIRNGHVIDPKNSIDAKMDVAVKDGKIARVANSIPASSAKHVVDATGLYVTPGFIDMHTHVFVGTKKGFAEGFSSVSPDDFTFKAGVTTVVDAGTSGAKNFYVFKEDVIDRSQTRVLAFLNIFNEGFSEGNAVENPEGGMDPQMTADTIKKYSDYIVGTRIGHFAGNEWTPFDNAIKAAEMTHRPLFVECHLPQYTLQQQLDRMRPGDIITHAYEDVHERAPVVDSSTGKLRPFVVAAQKKGVLFDVGHGGAGFWFSQAIPAMRQGLVPNSFGTDLHRFSMNAGMKDMLNVMSKFLNMGMSLHDVILHATWAPAKSIKREDLGNLSEGSVADIAVVKELHGKFGFVDAGRNRLDGNKKLQAEMTVRAGKIVFDLNGISAKKLDSKYTLVH